MRPESIILFRIYKNDSIPACMVERIGEWFDHGFKGHG